MREILFRGKRKDNNEWIIGHLHKMDGYGTGYTEYGIQVQITSKSRPWSAIVAKETIGQFTGLTDKNGRKIFEGDIVEHNHPYGGKSVHVVIWDKYGWNLSDFCATYFDYPGEAFSEGTRFVTVIGNVFDNPELLEVGK